ncbi:MAG TPA: lysophospholipid acyltransferase family protein [Rubricoccaceae bacterium]|jgi:1-acyl-sn-glycerol-3-phosphate acyltransferase
MTPTAVSPPAPAPPLAARLWFAWVLVANALVLLVLWVPGMLDLKLHRTARTLQRWARPWSWTALSLAGIRVETVLEPGAEATPTGPVVYVANHQAMADIPVLVLAIREPFLFVARVALARLPLIGSVLKASVCVFLDRSQPGGGEAALAEAEARLALGESVLFFPEGTRRYAGPPGPFFAGAFRLAARAGVPVVPVAIGGSHRLSNERERTARPGRVRVGIGAPLRPEPGETPEALAERARGHVARLLGGL